jgi:chromosomal replication initiator protein
MLATALSTESAPLTPWQACQRYIEEKVPPSTFETWFRVTELVIRDDGCACIQVPNKFAADIIEANFHDLIKEALAACGVSFSALAFEQAVGSERALVEQLAEQAAETKSRQVPQIVSESTGRFNSDYTFDTFVEGDSNAMALTAARSVAEKPGNNKFNPLIIYGGTGLGKTHLLQAIGHYAQAECTVGHVVYITSEEFLNEYKQFLRDKKSSFSFYKKFMDTDLLLIDDIQFFSGKQETQEQFYLIFNKLLQENKQIVLSSDCLPENIPDLEARIIKRFQGGLNIDVMPPNLETRMAILRKKAESGGHALPDEVVQYIAEHTKSSNVRVLLGILIKYICSTTFHDTGFTLDIAKELCGGAITGKEERLSMKRIMDTVADAYGIGVNQLSAHTRKKEAVLPRFVAMYLCRKWTQQTNLTIGLEFGNRNHATVISAVKKIEANLADEGQEELRAKVAEIEVRLRELS